MVQIFLSCYKRSEYTKVVLENLNHSTLYKDCQFYLIDDGSGDRTRNLFEGFKAERPNTIIKVFNENKGLRVRLLEFFKEAEGEYLCKVDNDCLFSEGWLTKLLEVKERSGYVVLAPNEKYKDPATKFARPDNDTDCFLVKVRAVGGMWLMNRDILKQVKFRNLNGFGVRGAWELMVDIGKQCKGKKGWTKEVEFEHIGNRKGDHELSITSHEYKRYIKEIGRGNQRGWWR
jgi:glycosyltransferase involved in cell wall biosynthesis